MYFTVLDVGARVPANVKSRAFLLTDNWDDWFRHSTLYTLIVVDAKGEIHTIGGVKVGQFSMEDNQRRPDLPGRFDELDDRFFSLGQDDSYYDELNALGPSVRDRVLLGLKDVALDLDLFDRALKEKVTGSSLLRSVPRGTVLDQFHRMARGGARLSRYEFSFSPPSARSAAKPVTLSFEVEPESFPPTNIHVLIGRNGVGKTTILNNMTRALADKSAVASTVGTFSISSDNRFFTNLVSVTFSAFDPFEPLPNRQDKSEGVQSAYIGLKRIGTTKDGKPLPPKSPEHLSREFGDSVSICRQGARASRWRRALEMLEADPIFRDAEVAALASEEVDESDLRPSARKLFGRLSSGHKIVLLTVTRLVETVEEKTLVLLDEPEAHLHPPLLSALVRALSDLLINRNGVAIIATHSPVVLQEVPSSCVWKIRRAGSRLVAERPETETFGESVGILTREVFGLEVSQSGFHKMLRDVVDSGVDFDTAVSQFDGQLGGEARAILRGLIAARDSEG
ncbi:MAG: AAA family ATPase [Pirellulaceae bacterium]